MKILLRFVKNTLIFIVLFMVFAKLLVIIVPVSFLYWLGHLIGLWGDEQIMDFMVDFNVFISILFSIISMVLLKLCRSV